MNLTSHSCNFFICNSLRKDVAMQESLFSKAINERKKIENGKRIEIERRNWSVLIKNRLLLSMRVNHRLLL